MAVFYVYVCKRGTDFPLSFLAPLACVRISVDGLYVRVSPVYAPPVNTHMRHITIQLFLFRPTDVAKVKSSRRFNQKNLIKIKEKE